MNDPVKYRGVAFEFGEKVIIVPPLSTSQLEEFSEKLDVISNATSFKMKELGVFLKNNLVPIALSAIQRNYPDIETKQVVDFVTTENWGEIAGALFGTSKAERVRLGERFPDVLPGKPSVISLPKLTGDGSEAALPAAPAGPGSTS